MWCRLSSCYHERTKAERLLNRLHFYAHDCSILVAIKKVDLIMTVITPPTKLLRPSRSIGSGNVPMASI